MGSSPFTRTKKAPAFSKDAGAYSLKTYSQ